MTERLRTAIATAETHLEKALQALKDTRPEAEDERTVPLPAPGAEPDAPVHRRRRPAHTEVVPALGSNEPMPVEPRPILKVDHLLLKSRSVQTGICVRAQFCDEPGSYDIAFLDRASLLAWLRSDGGNNPMAENVVGILLGHGRLHPTGRDHG